MNILSKKAKAGDNKLGRENGLMKRQAKLSPTRKLRKGLTLESKKFSMPMPNQPLSLRTAQLVKKLRPNQRTRASHTLNTLLNKLPRSSNTLD